MSSHFPVSPYVFISDESISDLFPGNPEAVIYHWTPGSCGPMVALVC